jgi:DNA mismatch endonuclease, patch repair protein
MDTLTPAERSARMSLVKSANTQPELALRRLVHNMGFRYRLHSKRILGRPDIANAHRRMAIFLHGCFWHRHDCPSGRRTPKSRTAFWSRKFEQNISRDHNVKKALRKAGWRSLVVWECELRNTSQLRRRLKRFLDA